MPVHIRFFAPYHLLVGSTMGELEAPAPFPAEDLPKRLLEAYPGLGNFMADPGIACHLRVLRDGVVLQPTDLVADGDHLQLIAPIMGG